MFALETKARKVIGELMRPVNQEMEFDRRVVAEFAVKVDGFIKRLEQIEYALGLQGCKPQIFEDIDNKISDMQAENTVSKKILQDEINMQNSKIDLLKTNFAEIF